MSLSDTVVRRSHSASFQSSTRITVLSAPGYGQQTDVISQAQAAVQTKIFTGVNNVKLLPYNQINVDRSFENCVIVAVKRSQVVALRGQAPPGACKHKNSLSGLIGVKQIKGYVNRSVR